MVGVVTAMVVAGGEVLLGGVVPGAVGVASGAVGVAPGEDVVDSSNARSNSCTINNTYQIMI